MAGRRPRPERGPGGAVGLDLAPFARQCRAMPEPSKTAKSKESQGNRAQSERAQSERAQSERAQSRGHALKRAGADEREQRLAAALRANLKRRKAQQRGRGAAEAAPAARTGPSGGGAGQD